MLAYTVFATRRKLIMDLTKMLEKLDLGQSLLREEQQKQGQVLISILDSIKSIHEPEDKVMVTESASLDTDKSPMPRVGAEQCVLFWKHAFVFIVLFGVRFLNVFGVCLGVFGVWCSGTVVLCSVFGSGVVLCSVFGLAALRVLS